MAATQASDSLISPGTATASTNAMAKLARAGLTEPRENGTGFGDLTVEKLLRDLLTPMLKDWLDQNLPAIVERVVEQEVKKLARRAELL
jgi:cell pole-organizing protein PopZ